MQTKLGPSTSTLGAGGNAGDKPSQLTEGDPLKEYLKEKKKEALHYVSSAAKLVAPIIE